MSRASSKRKRSPVSARFQVSAAMLRVMNYRQLWWALGIAAVLAVLLLAATSGFWLGEQLWDEQVF